jgi:menaquinone-dependent protoporphyrinogen IX oxidase
MEGLIVYQSQYGATETYALWIAEETGYQPVHYQAVSKNILKNTERIILGCSVIAGKPKLTGWIKNHWEILKDKRPLLFTTSGAVPTDPVLLDSYRRVFPEHIQEVLKYYPLGGRMIFDKMSWVMKLLLRVGQSFQSDPTVKARMVENVDRIDRDSIKPILSQIAMT